MKSYKNSLKILALPIIVLLAGILLIGLGIYEKITSPTKGFETATGYFSESTLYKPDRYDSVRHEFRSATYKLTYRFTVNSKEYFITSEYSTAFVPAEGTPCEIMYNPKNPNDAVIGGPHKRSNIILFIGIFFSLCSLAVFKIIAYAIKPENQRADKESQKKRNSHSSMKSNLPGAVFGILSVLFGYGAFTIISNSFSIKDIINYCFTSFKISMIIPIMLIAVGLFTVIDTIFVYFKNINKR